MALDDGSVFLLDPFETPLGPTLGWPGWKELIEDPGVTKIIWAAQNDVRVLKSCLGLQLRGLWDLFDAACLTVTPRPSLPLLVDTFLGKAIEKAESLQISDWSTRPLTFEQLTYAAQDVQYLLSLADQVDPLLDRKKKREAFLTRMQTAEAYTFSDHPEPWRRLKGAGTLLPDELERLEQVWRRREALAQRHDLAPWRLVPQEELVRWAREQSFSSDFTVDPRWVSG